ncbi:MAG: DUF4243 domain-containing protein [Pyrinomonadaceae bacterium]|nr:DUF4243 domain-containing protein [Pyrinomonadaceae bacterium]
MTQQHSKASSSEQKNTVMDQALEIFSRTGPEYASSLSNHGPMAAEALVALGRHEAVIPWAERYKRKLREQPEARNAIARQEWRTALGDFNRAGDWVAFFNLELKENSWRSMLGEWLPQLAPGLAAAAAHGLLRTAHATRSLAQMDTALRQQELAQGLAYWAARYQILPLTLKQKSAGLKPSQAIKQVKTLPPEQRKGGLISTSLRQLDEFPPFAPVANLVDAEGDASRFLSDLTETFAALYLANPTEIFSFVHAVTGPSAIRLLLPYVKPEETPDMLRYGWQAAAGLYAAFGHAPAADTFKEVEQDRDDLIDRSVAARDEHAVKFTEACLREYALNPKPVYLLAARHAADHWA